MRDEIIGTNEKYRRTYVVKRGVLVPIPKGMVMMVPGNLKAALSSPLFGFNTKRGFLSEVFSKPRERDGDVSVREFVRDHFPQGVLTYLTEPLLSGVYGGDSSVLSANSVLPRFVSYERQFGSLIRGVRKEKKPRNQGPKSLFLSFRGGMRTLVDSLSREISSSARIVQAEATELTQQDGKWRINAGTEFLESRGSCTRLSGPQGGPPSPFIRPRAQWSISRYSVFLGDPGYLPVRSQHIPTPAKRFRISCAAEGTRNDRGSNLD